MKRIIMLCLTITALAFAGAGAFAQDVPKDTQREKQPRDSMYHRKPAVTPRDTVHKAPPAKPNKPQPGNKTNTGQKSGAGEQTPPK